MTDSTYLTLGMSQPADLRMVFYPRHSPTDIVSALVPLIQDSTTIAFLRTLVKFVGEVANERPRDNL